jgi:hypothetical protein
LNQLELFSETLPARPLATDDFTQGLHRWPKVEALTKRYVQANPDKVVRWLAYDVDRPGAAHDWQLLEAPAPSITVENQKNGHAHLLYALGWPVLKVADGEPLSRALWYTATVQEGLRVKLDADPSYSGVTVKNPLCQHWNVQTWQEALYDLPWLAEYVNLEALKDRRRRLPDHGLGRNVNLFNDLRRWAYRYVHLDWHDYDRFLLACRDRAGELNTFTPTLPLAEIRSTAKSVARWTWERRESFIEGFSARQRARIRMRWGNQVQERRQMLLGFESWTSRQVESVTGIPARTVRRLRGSRPLAVSPVDKATLPASSRVSGSPGPLCTLSGERIVPEYGIGRGPGIVPEYGIGTPPERTSSSI